MSQKSLNIGIAVCLIALASILRLLPHPDNFAPIAAVALFGGAVLPRRYALAVPLAAMVATDLIIGVHDLFLVTWGAYVAMALGANLWLKKVSVKKVAVFALAGSLMFFVVTNFAVWLTSGMYEHTMSGLIQCYVLALPFFRNSLLGDLFYSGALFSLFAYATQAEAKRILPVSD